MAALLFSSAGRLMGPGWFARLAEFHLGQDLLESWFVTNRIETFVLRTMHVRKSTGPANAFLGKRSTAITAITALIEA